MLHKIQALALATVFTIIFFMVIGYFLDQVFHSTFISLIMTLIGFCLAMSYAIYQIKKYVYKK